MTVGCTELLIARLVKLESNEHCRSYNDSRNTGRTWHFMGSYSTLPHLALEHFGVLPLTASFPSSTLHEVVKWASMATLGSSFCLMDIGVWQNGQGGAIRSVAT